MKLFLRCFLWLAFAAQAEIGLSPTAENATAASNLERALYRLMPLPGGSVLARRAPEESRQELDSLIKQSATNAELFAVRAQEDERQLDFAAAEKDWRQSVELSKDKRAALRNLAGFYQWRLEPKQEVQTLLAAANLPAPPDDSYKNHTEQDAWIFIARALQVSSQHKLPAETRNSIYETWIKRYPKQAEPLHSYFRALLGSKDITAARAVASRIHSTFPDDLSLGIETDADLARSENGDRAAMDVYAKQFSPLWPADLRTSYFSLLSQTHQLRAFLADARTQTAANQTAIDPAFRAFFYFEQEGKNDLAGQQLLELEARRATMQTAWTASELKALGTLFARVPEYDEAAHAYYSLYALRGASEADKSLALSSLIDLLLDVPEQSLQLGSRDLSIYRNVATLDRHPGFLNGILSLVLNTTMPDEQYQTASQAGIAYFHRATAAQLIERMKSEFPNSQLIAPLEAKLFSAYSVYGQSEAILRLVPGWLTAHKNAADHTKVALLLGETCGATHKVAQELAIYDSLLQKLGEETGHRPLGEIEKNTQVGGREEVRAKPARSAQYAQVLDLYISRLTLLKRLPEAIAIYRREIDRNPNDPGIYERLALFVEQNHFNDELEQTYRAAMKRFGGATWPDKLARLYIRRREAEAYVALAKDLTDRFDGSELAQFISAVPPGSSFDHLIYRQVNLYAHQRFPHNLTFVRNLLASYQIKNHVDMGAYERLLRENWFSDSGLRKEFFEFLSRNNRLQEELAALPKPEQSVQQKNTAALLQYAEGKAWLADFEGSAPAFVSLAGLTPGDDAVSMRTISVERSLAPSIGGAFSRAVRLAEQRGQALPADPAAATLVGEIYADREQFGKAATWWNKIAIMRPGVEGEYLTAATVFWDYYQFPDSLRVIQNARVAAGDPALYAYEAGAIHENQNDYSAAIEEYLKSALAAPVSAREAGAEVGMAERRLMVLAKRLPTAAEIERKTASLTEAGSFNVTAFHLRLALLENQERRQDIHFLLANSLNRVTELEQLEPIQAACERLGFDDLSVLALRRAVALNGDPVEKLGLRLQLAKFHQTHQDVSQAESEYSALLTENPNLLGIVRANIEFYWTGNQKKKAVATLEAAASRAQPPYQTQFRREAAQKAADSGDFAAARRLLELLLKSDPYNADLLAVKAAIYASEGDNKSLMAFYSDELVQLKAASLPEEEKTSRLAGLRRGYINALIIAKQFADALEQYQQLLNVFPEDETLTREATRFAEHNQMAGRLTAYYEKASTDSPRNYRWPMLLARINVGLRRYPDAIAAWDKAAYVRPDRADFYLAKADLETRLLRFDDAINTYQKLYEVSYHDSQYLVSQASLQARLGRHGDAVRLLKAAYVDPHPKELNGYVEVMSQLAAWHFDDEIDQIYQQAKPLLKAGNGDAERLASLEAQALVLLRRPVEALEILVSVRRAAGDPKHPWNLQPQVAAIGAAVDDLYTPEEKAAFAKTLETPQALPSEINIYDIARASGFAELAAKRLYQTALGRQRDAWRPLEYLQSTRLLNAQLAQQLEAIAPRVQNREAINQALLAAYVRAGDEASELRLARARLIARTGSMDVSLYARLLVHSKADLPAAVRELNTTNAEAANQLTQALLGMAGEKEANAVIEARGGAISNVWTHAYSALTGLFYSSPTAGADFDLTLGPRTVDAQLARARGDALEGAIWYYYAARYADYLAAHQNSAAAGLLAATVEAAPAASNSYVELGKNEFELGKFEAAEAAYGQALELSADRADVHILLAEAEQARGRSQESASQLRIAFETLAKRASADDYEIAKTALIRMNQHVAVKELQPAAEALLAVDLKKNGGYQFVTLAEGILTAAPDRDVAMKWILRLAPSPEDLIASALLTDAEQRPFYAADIEKKRAEVAKSAGEAQSQAQQNLRSAQLSYAQYLNRQGDAPEGWRVLQQIEPKTERPADLLLELAAKTGRLSETLATYGSGETQTPTADQALALASVLRKDHADWSLEIREWEYRRELRAENAPAAAYLGMAEVRLEQRRTGEALALLRDVTLSVDAPFQNLSPAIRLLEKAGLQKEAADYAREWKTAEPWNPEAAWAVARTKQDKALLEALRKSGKTNYSLRAAAARSLRDLKSPVSGTTELDLLTHSDISTKEARQQFFVLSRLRAKLYAEAIAVKPSLGAARLALAQAAFQGGDDNLGLAAWNSYDSVQHPVDWLHSAPLDDAMEPEPDRTKTVEELAAGGLTRQRQYEAAEVLYDRILQQAKDGRIEKLRDAVKAKRQREQLNRSREPIVTANLTQARIVRPRLGGTE